MDAHDTRDAQRIVAAYLKVVEAQAAEDVYPGSLRDLPHPKDTIRTAFRTAVAALAATQQLTQELRTYLEVAYVSLADYVDAEGVQLMREYARAADELAADTRLPKDKTGTESWQRLREQSRLAGEMAKAMSDEANQLRAEFRQWHNGVEASL